MKSDGSIEEYDDLDHEIFSNSSSRTCRSTSRSISPSTKKNSIAS